MLEELEEDDESLSSEDEEKSLETKSSLSVFLFNTA
jgi:hypothetical protein